MGGGSVGGRNGVGGGRVGVRKGVGRGTERGGGGVDPKDESFAPICQSDCLYSSLTYLLFPSPPVCLYLSVCLYLYVFLSLSVCLPLSVCLSVSVCHSFSV